MPMLSPTVLLAEDEPVIALDIRLLLEQEGIRVIEPVTDLETACKLWHPQGIILNFSIPGKKQNELEIARQLTKKFQVRAMIVTGAARQQVEIPHRNNNDITIIYKPYLPANFRRRALEWLSLPA